MTASHVRTPSRATKTTHVGMGLYDVAVTRTRRLSPHLVRITLAGEGLRDFLDDGPDQRFKLLLPRPGQDRPLLPDSEDWYGSWREMAPDERPVLRTYTIRAARPAFGEVDVDVVLHEPSGPASRWAATAEPGDRVAIYAAWAEYEVPVAVRRQLVAGDHAALPAIAAICERLPDDAAADVLIEVADADDWLDLRVPPGVELRWLAADPGRPGAALRRAVLALPGDPPWQYAWVAAERDTVTALRRHLLAERGLTPDQVMFMGYWRTGGAIDD